MTYPIGRPMDFHLSLGSQLDQAGDPVLIWAGTMLLGLRTVGWATQLLDPLWDQVLNPFINPFLPQLWMGDEEFCLYMLPGLNELTILGFKNKEKKVALTHWGRVTHICVGNLTSIDSDNGLSPERRQAITWTNAGLFLIGSLGTNFSDMLFGIQTFSFKKMHFKMSSGKWRPFCLGLNELKPAMSLAAMGIDCNNRSLEGPSIRNP